MYFTPMDGNLTINHVQKSIEKPNNIEFGDRSLIAN